MKKCPCTKLIVLLFIMTFLITSGCGINNQDMPKAKIQVKVLDVSGNPFAGAEVFIGFFHLAELSRELPIGKKVTGKTNSKGMFPAIGRTTGKIRIHVKKAGYYTKEQTLDLAKEDSGYVKDGGKWIPQDNVIEFVLKKKKYLGDATIPVKVVDEEGNPFPGATVKIIFHQFKKKSDKSHATEKFTGETDTEGIFTATAETLGKIRISVKKDGYYEWYKLLAMMERNSDYTLDEGEWLPKSKIIEVVLKKIADAAPMYVKRVETIIPIMNTPIGYDLQAGDWVKPYGCGIHNDFLFTASGHFKSLNDFVERLTLAFSHKGDGITARNFKRHNTNSYKKQIREAPDIQCIVAISFHHSQ